MPPQMMPAKTDACWKSDEPGSVNRGTDSVPMARFLTERDSNCPAAAALRSLTTASAGETADESIFKKPSSTMMLPDFTEIIAI